MSQINLKYVQMPWIISMFSSWRKWWTQLIAEADIPYIWTSLAPNALVFIGPDSQSEPNPRTWSFLCKINLKLDGWAWLLLPSTSHPSSCHFSLFLFLRTLPHLCRLLQVTALLATNVDNPINAHVVRDTSFCICNEADCSNYSKHFLQTGIKAFSYMFHNK